MRLCESCNIVKMLNKIIQFSVPNWLENVYFYMILIYFISSKIYDLSINTNYMKKVYTGEINND